MSDTDPKDPKDVDPKDPKEDPPADKDWQAEADKWKALARKHETQAKTNADAARKLSELEDADKTEIQRATDKATQAEQRATAAEARLTRMEVALDKAPDGMPLAKVRKLAGRLTGENRDELEADAEELFADFTPDKGDDPDDAGDNGRRRPRERLRSGAAPDAEPEETDPEKLAAQVPRMY